MCCGMNSQCKVMALEHFRPRIIPIGTQTPGTSKNKNTNVSHPPFSFLQKFKLQANIFYIHRFSGQAFFPGDISIMAKLVKIPPIPLEAGTSREFWSKATLVCHPKSSEKWSWRAFEGSSSFLTNYLEKKLKPCCWGCKYENSAGLTKNQTQGSQIAFCWWLAHWRTPLFSSSLKASRNVNLICATFKLKGELWLHGCKLLASKSNPFCH